MFVGSKGLRKFERGVMQKLVVKFWKQGWQATVNAARLMELVRQECGAMGAVLDVWRRSARIAVQDAWYLMYKLQFICGRIVK